MAACQAGNLIASWSPTLAPSPPSLEKMDSEPPSTPSNRAGPSLIQLPAEVLTDIMSCLFPLTDVIALSSTCQKMRNVWLENANVILSRIATGAIPCKREACRLALAQNPARPDVLAAPDAVRLVQNARQMEKVVKNVNDTVMTELFDGNDGNSISRPPF
jgi:hypothetical protein